MTSKRTWILALALVVAAIGPSPALAANVSANCTTSGGYFSTYGTADNWQDHWHAQSLQQFFYSGRQYRQYGWGWAVGWQGGEVFGTRLSGAGAGCLI